MRSEMLVAISTTIFISGGVVVAGDVQEPSSGLSNGVMLRQVVANLFTSEQVLARANDAVPVSWSAFASSLAGSSNTSSDIVMTGDLLTGGPAVPGVVILLGSSGGSGWLDNPGFMVHSGGATQVSTSNGGSGTRETVIPLPTPLAMGFAGVALVAGMHRRRSLFRVC